jgi:hypothetical protein
MQTQLFLLEGFQKYKKYKLFFGTVDPETSRGTVTTVQAG